MTARTCLKAAAIMLREGDSRVFFGARRDLHRAIDLAAETTEERIEAFDLLDEQAIPARAAAERATRRWVQTGADADAIRALELWQAPGADQSIEQWLAAPGRSLGHVLAIFSGAINKPRSEQ